ncbi:hypothetical protein MK489_09370 [Myxococcota bacterium]|nr:hypothetical protein [Myxococcota bacterium]
MSARVILDDPNACKQHFSSERWREYTTDLDWMRARLPSGKWRNLLMDHGYNATPVWGVVGGLLTDSQSLSRSQLRILTLIDPAMLVIMWLAVTWAFGWRSACVGIVFWGTNDFAGFEWVGGGILRQDWLVASVVGICFLRRNHPVAGGFLLGWATLLRIFPGCLLLGLALHAATFAWKVGIKELRKTHLPIALGAGLSVALMVPLSGALMGRADSVGDDARGLAVWADFAENARVHLATPLPNHIGLQTLIAYDPAQTARETRDIRKEDPFEDWKRMRRETRDQRSGLLVVLTVGFLMLFTGSVRRGSTWEVAIVSIGIIPFATELTNYYYAILIAYAGLWGVRQEIGLGLVALGLLSWGLVDWFHYYDEIFTAASAAILVFVLFATIRMPNPKNSRTPSQAL